MIRRVRSLTLTAVIAAFVGACAGPLAGEIVWASGAPLSDAYLGARIIDCPVSDCQPLFTAAAERLWRGGPRITRSRLGIPVCGRDPAVLCMRTGPIGGTDIYEVVLDRTDGSVVLIFVQCWSTPTEGAVAWNGMEWCQPVGNG